MKHRVVLFFSLGIFLTVALNACNPISRLQRSERFEQLQLATNTYRKLVRWGQFDQASQYLKAKDDADELPTPDLSSMMRYKVTGFTVAEEILSATKTEAKVSIVVEFYNVDTGRASAVRDTQFWWYDEEAKRWWLGTPMLSFAENEH